MTNISKAFTVARKIRRYCLLLLLLPAFLSSSPDYPHPSSGFFTQLCPERLCYLPLASCFVRHSSWLFCLSWGFYFQKLVKDLFLMSSSSRPIILFWNIGLLLKLLYKNIFMLSFENFWCHSSYHFFHHILFWNCLLPFLSIFFSSAKHLLLQSFNMGRWN